MGETSQLKCPTISLILIVTVVSVAILSGCATITKGSSQTMTVDTKPPGARCILSRVGQKIAEVNSTPGSITVKKSSDPISVSCTKDGYQESAGTLESHFQAMTFGNILFGGLIGVVVDSSSGAAHEYEPLVTITLIPEEFASEEERDAFFAQMKEDFLKQSKEVTDRIAKSCDPATNCDSQLQAAQAAKEARLADIEKKRLLAKVKQ
ncbi:MAG TPA: hypothetical protein VEJ22_05090 [Nitrospirota bacterium]|nr:hypothetical protein [Nitrospirota bacterium]